MNFEKGKSLPKTGIYTVHEIISLQFNLQVLLQQKKKENHSYRN